MTDAVFGMDLDLLECDVLLFRFVRREWREMERALFAAKWFDYRFLHPVRATYLYAHHWVQEYRLAYRQNIHAPAADSVKPLKVDDLFQCPRHVITAMWRGRQHADALGMPYDLYIRFAINQRLRFWQQRFLPRPAHLYAGDIVNKVAGLWEEHLSSINVVASHAEYRLQHYVGLPHQDEHHEWLMGLAEQRPNPAAALASFLDDELLPEQKILARFGEDVMQRVREYV